MYVLAGFLVVGFLCNMAVRPVPEGLFVLVSPDARGDRPTAPAPVAAAAPSGQWGLVAGAWLLAALPLGWGVLKTLTLASRMFR
jgi:hypothetical protein